MGDGFDDTAHVPGAPPVLTGDPASPDPLIGQLLAASYRVTRLVGRGGMGVVYEARHVRLPKRYAVKILRQVLTSDPDAFARFRREAEIASSLGSRHIAEVFDFNTMDDGTPFIIMEFLEGQDLARLMRARGRLEAREALGICEQVVSALSTAHARQIVHRDIKPENIFLVPDEKGQPFVKLVDFGVSKIRDATGVNLTQSQTWLGTPAFMSPEQASGGGRSVDQRSDIYSLAAVLYVALTGRHLFDGENLFALVQKIIHEAPPSMLDHAPDLPPGVDQVILGALAKDPDERPASVEELLSRFKGALDGQEFPRAAKDRHIRRVEPSVLGAFPGTNVTRVDGPRPKRKRPAATPAILVGAVLCMGAVLAYSRFSGERHREARVASPAPTPVPPPARPRAQAPARLEIESTPSGAEVWRAADGIRLGKTPFTQEIAPSAGDAVFILRYPGYRDERVELAADRDGTKGVSLSPLELAAPLARGPQRKAPAAKGAQTKASPAPPTAPLPAQPTEPAHPSEPAEPTQATSPPESPPAEAPKSEPPPKSPSDDPAPEPSEGETK